MVVTMCDRCGTIIKTNNPPKIILLHKQNDEQAKLKN